MRKKEIDFAAAKESKEILTGFVKLAQKGVVKGDSSKLIVECSGKKVIIEEQDVEPLPFNQSLAAFVGLEIKFVVLDYIEEVNLVYGSNKIAEEIIRKPIMDKLMSGEVCEGIVSHIVPYGAYVNIGGVSGLLKNYNFADDGSSISDFYKEGQKIKVKFMKVSSKGTLIFAPEEVIRGKSPINFGDFSVGQLICGKVVKVMSDKVFVNLVPGIDCLCSNPRNIDRLIEGEYVRVKISRVMIEKGRIRGVILDCVDR